MAVHRVGKTLLIDEFNAPLFFRETVKVKWYTRRKDKVAMCGCVSLETSATAACQWSIEPGSLSFSSKTFSEVD